jgi:hypothetical protein
MGAAELVLSRVIDDPASFDRLPGRARAREGR